jgi:hypothetical protein
MYNTEQILTFNTIYWSTVVRPSGLVIRMIGLHYDDGMVIRLHEGDWKTMYIAGCYV